MTELIKFAFIHNGKYVILEKEWTDFMEDFVYKGVHMSQHLNNNTDIDLLKLQAIEANYLRVHNKQDKYGFIK